MFGLGLKTLRRLCEEQDTMAWHRAKLSTELFTSQEAVVFNYVEEHLRLHHKLPQVVTLEGNFPDLKEITTPEPYSYYVKHLENQFFYRVINAANLESQQVLKDNQENHEKALAIIRECQNRIVRQKYRLRILDVGEDAAAMVLTHYHGMQLGDLSTCIFGWPLMDDNWGGGIPGDVISIVGRPAAGKTWLSLWTGIRNWVDKKVNVLFVSMEMNTLPIAQRLMAMYTNQNISQLKLGAYSSVTYKKFVTGLKGLQLEKAKFFVIDGNLAASAEDVYALADMLECGVIVVDGAYLLRHKNIRLDRFTRAAENMELLKRYTTDQDMTTFASWQFSRDASKKLKKGDKAGKNQEDVGLEDIGYTDAIGQASSIVLGLFEEEGIETMKQRKVRIMKGRNGEVGKFTIAWDFISMDFKQIDPPIKGQVEETEPDLQFV